MIVKIDVKLNTFRTFLALVKIKLIYLFTYLFSPSLFYRKICIIDVRKAIKQLSEVPVNIQE